MRYLLVLIGLFLRACATLRPEDSLRAWLADQGPVVHDGRDARAQAAVGRLLAAAHLDGPCQVRVLASAGVTAYTWPGGQVYVTSGLVDRCSDAELAAALAHELGHLINDGHMTGPVSLKGRYGTDEELAADLTGVQVLQRAGIPTSALPAVLQLVCDSQLSRTCKANIDRRILRLDLLAREGKLGPPRP